MPPKKGKQAAAQAAKAKAAAPSAAAGAASATGSSSGTASFAPAATTGASASALPLWLTTGTSVRDKNVLCENVYIYTPDGATELIKNAKVQFVHGRRYGLIGANGRGKTTLLNHISAYDLPGFPAYLRVIHVQQHDIVSSDEQVLDFVVASDAEKSFLEQEEERLVQLLEDDTFDPQSIDEATQSQVNDKLALISERLCDMDARRAEQRAAAILTGLQFTAEMQRAPISTLSGGWRQRVALACALQATPDLLLLDEPTNHLDFPAVRWLQEYLKKFEQTLVIVSHDRAFLNSIITDVMELHAQKLEYYKGNYDVFVQVKGDLIKQRKHDYEVQQKKLTEMRQYIEEAKKSDNQATMQSGKARQVLLAKMERDELIEPVVEDKAFKFSFPVPGKLDHALLEINDMSFAYSPDKPLLEHVNLHMDLDSRIAVLGLNGSGKSTLIKLILGKLKATSGVCRLDSHARAAVFDQHHAASLDMTKSSLDYLMTLFPEAKEHHVRGVLGRFGFDQALAGQRIGTLSGGQKSRVAFAILTWREPHLLIMDEPTNHLDLDTIEALIGALKAFAGAVLIVSHDIYFLESIATEFWSVSTEEKAIEVFYELEEAKEFSYNLAAIDELQVGSKQSLIKDYQAAKNAQKAKADKSDKPTAAGDASAALARAGGKNKKKSKGGAKGVVMAELDVDAKLAQLAEEEAKQRLADETAKQQQASSSKPSAAGDGDDSDTSSDDSALLLQLSKAAQRKKAQQMSKMQAAMMSLEIEEGESTPSEDDGKVKRKKKKSKRDKAVDEAADSPVDSEDEAERKRRKRERKEKRLRKEAEAAAAEAGADADDAKAEKKKKKNSSRHVSDDEDEARESIRDTQSEAVSQPTHAGGDSDGDDDKARKKSKKSRRSVETKAAAPAADEEQSEDEATRKERRKKKKAERPEAQDDDGKGKKKKQRSRDVDDDAPESAAAAKREKKVKKPKSRDAGDDAAPVAAAAADAAADDAETEEREIAEAKARKKAKKEKAQRAQQGDDDDAKQAAEAPQADSPAAAAVDAPAPKSKRDKSDWKHGAASKPRKGAPPVDD